MVVKMALQKIDVHQVRTKWAGQMLFESLANGHIIRMDKVQAFGGKDAGPRPKPLFLSAIGGCTGMEIIAIADKMRLKIESLDIDVSGELNHQQPKIYTSVHLLITIKSPGTDPQKIQRAVALATEKYCGILAMVRRFASVNIQTHILK